MKNVKFLQLLSTYFLQPQNVTLTFSEVHLLYGIYNSSSLPYLEHGMGINFHTSSSSRTALGNFNFDFLHKDQLKTVKTISAHSKSPVSIF
jgi:hypothetical protein